MSPSLLKTFTLHYTDTQSNYKILIVLKKVAKKTVILISVLGKNALDAEQT